MTGRFLTKLSLLGTTGWRAVGVGMVARRLVSSPPRPAAPTLMGLTSVYIGEIQCSAEVAAKIASKHGVDLQEVRDAVQWPARPLKASILGSDLDPRGPRLAVEGHTGRRIIRVVLYPVDPEGGTWRLATAVPVT